ncbi:hypothetical protein [Streptomyces sp. NPDC003395]
MDATTELRDRIAQALIDWTYQNGSQKYAALRRDETVRANAYSRADAVLAVLPPADRAPVRPQTLTSIAAHLDARAVAILRPESQTYAEWQTVVALLRRMAGEAQPATETSLPSDTLWHVQTRQRGTWRPWLAPRDDHAEAREDYDRCIADNGHRWAFRLIRETSTYTIEAEHIPSTETDQDGAGQ